MSQIIVIEPKPEHLKFISQAVLELVPDAVILNFRTLKDFQKQLKLEHVAPQPKDPARQIEKKIDLKKIRLVIADSEDSAAVPIDLWKKFMDLLATKAEGGEIPKLIMTSYEHLKSHVEVEKYIHSFVFNLLIKPFDPLVMKQILQLALKKDGSLKPEGIYTQEGDGNVEMIKDIEIEVLTELGFRTLATREIPLGRRARYFGSAFESQNTNSIFAYCYKNTPTPKGPKNFSSSFSYLGVGKEQIASIRRLISENKDKKKLEFQPGEDYQKHKFFHFTRNSDQSHQLFDLLKNKFKGLTNKHFVSLSHFIQHLPSDKLGQLSKEQQVQSLFPKSGKVQLNFNSSNFKLIEALMINNEKNEVLKELFGISVEELKKLDFTQKFFKDESGHLFQKWLKDANSPSESRLTIEYDLHKIFCKVIARNQITEPLAMITIQLQELSNEEKLSYLKEDPNDTAAPSMVFVDQKGGENIASIKAVFSQVYGEAAKIKYYAINEKPISHYNQLSSIDGFDDAFQTPFDVFYLSRKIKMHDETLVPQSKEENFRYAINFADTIQTAMPVTLKSISEVHLTINYNRALNVGDVRRFILWIPNTANMPEIHGVCRHVEEAGDGDHRCDFLLFGVHETQLKYIRKWIMEEYVNKKGKEGG